MKLVSSIIAGSLGVIVGALIGYYGSYLQISFYQKQELAKDLASYYSAAASEYYSYYAIMAADKAGIPKSSPYYIELMKEEDADYSNFLTSSTKLGSEVRPDLRERVFSIESTFDNIPDKQDPKTEDQWFAKLDGIRSEVLSAITFSRWLNPIWK